MKNKKDNEALMDLTPIVESFNTIAEAVLKTIEVPSKETAKPVKNYICDEYETGDCPNCGKSLIDRSTYCKHCGQKLEWPNSGFDGVDIGDILVRTEVIEPRVALKIVEYCVVIDKLYPNPVGPKEPCYIVMSDSAMHTVPMKDVGFTKEWIKKGKSFPELKKIMDELRRLNNEKV